MCVHIQRSKTPKSSRIRNQITQDCNKATNLKFLKSQWQKQHSIEKLPPTKTTTKNLESPIKQQHQYMYKTQQNRYLSGLRKTRVEIIFIHPVAEISNPDCLVILTGSLNLTAVLGRVLLRLLLVVVVGQVLLVIQHLLLLHNHSRILHRHPPLLVLLHLHPLLLLHLPLLLLLLIRISAVHPLSLSLSKLEFSVE